MQTWRRRLADSIRLLGVALMISVAVIATYLELDGVLDPALLPYFLAFSAYCTADIIAVIVASDRNLFTRTAGH
jgi:hypothetical protein